MNEIATLIYEEVVIENGKSKVVPSEKEVFCEVNSLSFTEQKDLDDLNKSAMIKCAINKNHLAKTLVRVKINDNMYTLISYDIFKTDDIANLLLKERVK